MDYFQDEANLTNLLRRKAFVKFLKNPDFQVLQISNLVEHAGLLLVYIYYIRNEARINYYENFHVQVKFRETKIASLTYRMKTS